MMCCDVCYSFITPGTDHRVYAPYMAIEATDESGRIVGGWASPDDWCLCGECFSKLLAHDIPGMVSTACQSAGLTESDEAFSTLSDMFSRIYSMMEVRQ